MPKKKSIQMAVAGGFVAVGLMLLACGVGNSKSGDPMQVGTGQSTGQSTAPQIAYHTPVAADFTLEVKVLEKSCFGAAGCNVTYRMGVAYSAAEPLDPNITYEITYEVKGTKDPKIGTLKVTGTDFQADEKEFVQTSSSGKQLTAQITAITPR